MDLIKLAVQETFFKSNSIFRKRQEKDQELERKSQEAKKKKEEMRQNRGNGKEPEKLDDIMSSGDTMSENAEMG